MSVTVGGDDGVESWALSTMSTAETIASATSTPAAHSRARWPEEKVRRGGGGGRWLPAVRARAARAGAARCTLGAARVLPVAEIAVGAARPADGSWLGRGGRCPERTAATASANGPPLG